MARNALTLRAGLAGIVDDQSPLADAVRLEFRAHLGSGDGGTPDERDASRLPHRDLHGRALQAARQAVIDMRTNEEIGDDAFHRMEEELDWSEMSGGGTEDGEADA